MRNIKILVVDDEKIVRDSLYNWFTQEGYSVKTASDAYEALKILQEETFHIALVDIKMPKMDGLTLLKKIKEIDENLVIIIITAYPSVDSAVDALKHGAFDYLVKPIDSDQLDHIIRNAVSQKMLIDENVRLKRELERAYEIEGIVGESSQIKEVIKLVKQVAPTDVPVLIIGESGTGKELVARAIHMMSKRKYFPFVAINIGALPEGLQESELFGHEKGAFTGAIYRRKGKIEIADGGTLFIDEVATMSIKTQIDLLRVLETKRFTRIGGNTEIEVDFRLICATNKDLEEEVKKGNFREDLFFRINVFPIKLPPLRERKSDIPLLVMHFIEKYNKKMNKNFKGVTDEAMEILQKYNWPGNVRELENAIERAMVVGKEPLITAEDLPIKLKEENFEEIGSLEEMEKKYIIKVLKKTNWNISQASEILKIDRKTLYNKMKKYGIVKE
ncbi:MAG: sigma-54 dependent transcriptional regulator [candidate division WOR-3 bacterium]